MSHEKLDLLKGTLDLLVLQILSSMGPLHGYGIARRLEQISGDELAMNEGTIYASLVRLQHRGLIKTAWGTSENNRRAKYYSLTRAGEKDLVAEATNWARLASVIGRVLATSSGGTTRLPAAFTRPYSAWWPFFGKGRWIKTSTKSSPPTLIS